MEYDTAIDIWSFGCITMELLTGTPLFPGTDEFDQVACIVEVLDLPPPSFVRNARRLNSFFCDSGRLRYHSADREKFCFSGASFTRTIQRAQPGSLTLEVLLQHSLGDVDPDLLDFVQRCLCWVPSSRLTASEALNHPWLRSLKSSETKTSGTIGSPESGEDAVNNTETDEKRSTRQLSRPATDPW
nr:unnamed protein product [Spirometra erinaceieuropaei]